MTNAQLSNYPNEYIIDAFIDNKINLLLMDELNDIILYKLYCHVNKILCIECEIRDISIDKLVFQSEALAAEKNRQSKHLDRWPLNS